MPPGSRFCPSCGERVDGAAAGRHWGWKDIALVVAIAAVVSFGLTHLAGRFVSDGRDVNMSPPPSAGARPTQPGRPVDLSTMTPREAADRLFNRVMAADERGDKAEAMRFAPMALMAYGRLDQLDADAHYHLGLLNLVAGNADAVRKQISELEAESPQHLLGLLLAFSLAGKVGDEKGAAAARARFAAAYDAEIVSNRPEYEAHRSTIVKFHASTAGSKAARPAAAQEGAGEGARIFAAKCAGCHGPEASGSDKGPPLVHRIYEPGHHGDDAFFRAVLQGVRAHHWPFGDMPPVPGVTTEQIGHIVGYVRMLQAKAGIK